MYDTVHWLTSFDKEITHAQNARLAGNEGMARVCARRAAGIIVGEYFNRNGFSTHTASAYQRLKLLESLPDIDPQVRQITTHFLLSVDKEHQLPVHIDLIAEVQWLAQQLLDLE